MSKFIELEGIAFYPKVFEHNRDMKGFEGAYEECNGAYTIEVVLNDVEYQKLQESGSKTEGKEHEEGRSVKFKRKHEVRNRKTGEIIEALSGAPQVVDADGNDWISTEDEPRLIGNHSRVIVAVSVEQDKKKKSIVYTRLEGVKVLDLVEPSGGEGEGRRRLPF